MPIALTASLPASTCGPGTAATLTLLAGFDVRSTSAHGPAPASTHRLIAYVGLHPGASRARVAGSLWPDVPDRAAAARLRTTLWRLGCWSESVVGVQAGHLIVDSTMSIDVDELASRASRLQRHHLRDADVEVLLHGDGGLLPDWPDEWVQPERERVRQMWLHALEDLAVLLLHAGRLAAAIQAVHVALRADPLRETPHRILLDALLAEGNRSEALRHADRYRRLLREELGIEPSPLLLAVVDDLLRPTWRTLGRRAPGAAVAPAPRDSPPRRCRP